MERITARDREQQLQYHLDDGRSPIFEETQEERIAFSRYLLDRVLKKCKTPSLIWDLGCGAGDVTGPVSNIHLVHGVDLVPKSEEECARRFPSLRFHRIPVENLEPYWTDVLVMCEFLEHVDDPIEIVKTWGSRAGWMIIGHPLYEPANAPIEPGHSWSYTEEDFDNWFTIAGHSLREKFLFPMGSWKYMAYGYGEKQ